MNLNFLKDGLSIDETKISSLIFAFVITFIYTLFTHYITGTIPQELVEILKWEIIGIGGINVAKKVSEAKGYIGTTKNYNFNDLYKYDGQI